MQFITDWLKGLNNPFIIEEEFSFKLKWLDAWTNNEDGYNFICKVTKEDGKISFAGESTRYETDSQFSYRPWIGKFTKKTTITDSLEWIIYQKLYDKWEGQLMLKYRNLGISEADVSQVYDEYLRRRQGIIEKEEARSKHTAAVYIIRMTGTDYYKIGIASNPKARLKQLQTGNPIQLEMIYNVRVLDSYGLEGYFHEKLRNTNVQNEWFQLNDATLNEIIELMSQKKLLTT